MDKYFYWSKNSIYADAERRYYEKITKDKTKEKQIYAFDDNDDNLEIITEQNTFFFEKCETVCDETNVLEEILLESDGNEEFVNLKIVDEIEENNEIGQVDNDEDRSRIYPIKRTAKESNLSTHDLVEETGKAHIFAPGKSGPYYPIFICHKTSDNIAPKCEKQMPKKALNFIELNIGDNSSAQNNDPNLMFFDAENSDMSICKGAGEHDQNLEDVPIYFKTPDEKGEKKTVLTAGNNNVREKPMFFDATDTVDETVNVLEAKINDLNIAESLKLLDDSVEDSHRDNDEEDHRDEHNRKCGMCIVE